MSTRYPVTLPAVPADRWGIASIGSGGDPDEGTAWADFAVPNAASAEEAELRVLARLDHDYEDDLRGAVATASPDLSTVRVRLAPPR